MAGTGAVGGVEQQALRGFHFYAESLRAWGGVSGVGFGDVDGVRLGVLADAGLFARAVCGGARRELFSGVCPGASGISVSLYFVAGSGSARAPTPSSGWRCTAVTTCTLTRMETRTARSCSA